MKNVPRIEDETVPQVISASRIRWFWIISMGISLAIGLGLRFAYGAAVSGNTRSFLAAVVPYAAVIGAPAGSFLFGIIYAADSYYNLWAYFLSAFSAVGGVLAIIIALVILYVAITVFLSMAALLLVLAIVGAIAGGF